MRLFWMEMRKILSWKLLLLIGVVNVLLFQLRLDFELENFPNGRPATDIFVIEQQIIPEYGATIDENEFEELLATYEELVTAADLYFAEDAQAKELEIANYQEFRNVDEDDEELEAYQSNWMFNDEQNFIWELQAWESLLENYEAQPMFLTSMIEQTSGSRQQHFEQKLSEERYSFYSTVVLDNFINYKTNMAIIILISIAMLTSPIFLRDYRSGMIPIQYTSKIGRKVYRAKWQAGLSSAALLAGVLLFIYMGLYWTNDTVSHFDLPLMSFGWYDYWYDLTFLQYILLSVVATFFVAMLLGVLSMAISTVVPNAIVLIGVQIVILFIMIAGVTTYLIREIMNIWLPQALVPAGYTVLAVLILSSCWLIWKRELRRDVV